MVTIAQSLSQGLLSSLDKTSTKESSETRKLASGKKTSDTTKSSIALIKSENITAALKGLDAAEENVALSSSLLDVAAGGMASGLTALQELNALAVQAADGTLSASDRESLTAQANSILDGMSDLASSLDFNGTTLLDGSFTEREVQVGNSEGQTITLGVDAATPESLGVSGIDLSTAASAGDAITAVQNAITELTSSMSEVGSQSERLDIASSTNSRTTESLQSARSAIEDTDVAESVMKLKALNLQKSLSATLIGKAGETQSKLLKTII